MASVRNRDTAAERAIRAILHARGLRYRVNHRVPGAGRIRPDIAFTRARIAVFVDGCFWHRCPTHATFPKSNADWWAEKLEKNVRRDRRNDSVLESMGWKVIRVWEHERPEEAADRIQITVATADNQ